MKVLHNQRFITPPYSQYAVYLGDIISPSIKKVFKSDCTEGFIAGAFLFYYSKYYDAVVTTGHRPALSFAFFNNFLKTKRVHVIKEFYIDEKSTSTRWKSYFFRSVFKNVRLIITSCTGETLYLRNWLKLPIHCFKFMPWPSNIPVLEDNDLDSGYVFAAGRSLRDWVTFFDAISGTGLKSVVVATKIDISKLTIPQEVALYCDIPHEEYLELLKRARFVVIPLRKTFRSVGASAILEAMALGKAIITPKVSGTIDYIRTGIDGLFYEPGNSSDLKSKILKLSNDSDLRKKIGKAGQALVKKGFNKQSYSLAMFKALSEICGGA